MVAPEVAKANTQLVINECKKTAKVIILVMPMPIAQSRVGSFSDDQMLDIYQSLAETNNLPLFRTDRLLGSWEEASAAGRVKDELHWLAPASDDLAKGLVPVVHAALKYWKA